MPKPDFSESAVSANDQYEQFTGEETQKIQLETADELSRIEPVGPETLPPTSEQETPVRDGLLDFFADAAPLEEASEDEDADLMADFSSLEPNAEPGEFDPSEFVNEEEGTLNIAPGFLETGGAVLRGGIEGVANTANTALEVAEFATRLGGEENLVSRGFDNASDLVEAGIAKTGEVIPDAPSLGGAFVKNLTQWYIGNRLVRRALPAGTGPRAKTAIAAVVPGAIAFDPYEARLSSMLEDTFMGPLVAPLVSRPDDPAIIARVKATMEEAAIGGAFETATAIVRAVRGARRTRKLAKKLARTKEAQDAIDQMTVVAQDKAAAVAHKKDTKRLVGLVNGTGDGSEQVLTSGMKESASNADQIRGRAWEEVKASPEFNALHPNIKESMLDIAEPRRAAARPERTIANAGRQSLARLRTLPNDEAMDLAVSIAKGDEEKGLALLGESFNEVLIDGTIDSKAALGHLSDRLHKHLPKDLQVPRTFERSTEFITNLAGRPVDEIVADLAGTEVATRQAGELMMAGEMALKGTNRRLRELAAEFVNQDPAAVNRETVEEFLRLSDGAAAIYNSLKGTQTNVARALNLRKLRTGFGEIDPGSDLLNKAIDVGAGGIEQVQALAHRVLTEGGLNDKALLDAISTPTLFQRADKAFRFFALSSMLSSVKTLAVNVYSNTAQMFFEPLIDGVAFGIERGSARQGMALYMAEMAPVLEGGYGLFRAAGQMARGSRRLAVETATEATEKLGINAYARTIRSGGRLKGLAVERGDQLNKFDAFSTDKLQELGIRSDGAGAFESIDDMDMRDVAAIETHWLKAIGKAFLPGTQLSAWDSMFTETAAQMGMRREAGRAAFRELGPTATVREVLDYAKTFEARIGQEAADAIRRETLVPLAKARTFQTELGKYGQAIQKLSEVPFIGKLVLPFVRTPTNILKYAHANTPVLNLATKNFLDAVVGEYKTLGRIGPKGAEFIARSAVGTAVLGSIYGLGLKGRLQGAYPNNDLERKQLQSRRIPEYSVNIGGQWVAFNRLDPFGMFFGVAADLTSYHKDILPEDQDIIGAGMMASIAKNLSERNYFMGMAALVEAFDDPDHKLAKLGQNYANLIVPNFFADIAKSNDPVLRDPRAYNDEGDIAELRSLMNGMMARVPGGPNGLVARRDIFGVVHRSPTVAIALKSGVERQSPVLNEMSKQGVPVDMTAVQRRGIMGVRLDGPLREEYGVLLTDTKRDGLTMSEALLETIRSNEYRSASDPDEAGNPGGRAEILQDTVRDYVIAAQDDMLDRHPEIEVESDQIADQKLQAREGEAQSEPGSTTGGTLNPTIQALIGGGQQQ